MAANPQPPADLDGFEETTDVPQARGKIVVSDLLWDLLKASSERGSAFTKAGTPDEIKELKRTLGSAAVKGKYDVTVNTEQVSNTKQRLKFSAKVKVTENTPAETAAS